MMKGINPVDKVKVPKVITLEFMLERAEQRRIALGCGRCGGTGKFSSVPFSGTGSSYGSHCFLCGDAWKLPRKWSSMGSNEIAALFINSADLDYAKTVIDDFIQVGIIDPDKGLEVLAHIGNGCEVLGD